MALSGLGDRAHLFAQQRHNASIRERLAVLTQEMSTGVAADMARHLGGDTAPLADVDRRLELAEGYGRAAREAGHRLSAMQVALGQAEGLRASLAEKLTAATGIGAGLDAKAVATAASVGAATFDDLVSTLNARWGEAALFGGTAVGPTALADADAMRSGINAAVAQAITAAGATTLEAIQTGLDTYFDASTGGFATTAYRGEADYATRAIDQGATVTLSARANSDALRGLLKAAATAELAGDPDLDLDPAVGIALLQGARNDAHGLSSSLTQLGADLGLAEARIEEATARHAARTTAYGLLRAEMTVADPYATATDLEAVEAQLETHYALTSRLSSLSLASYLR